MAVILFVAFHCNKKCILVTVKCHLVPNRKLWKALVQLQKRIFTISVRSLL